MPDDRFLHPRLGRSRKVSSLDDFQARVWSHGYLLCADDFGVMPRAPEVLRGFNIALANRSDREVAEALTSLVEIGLLLSFEHQGDRFVCDPVWQDFQHIRRPRRSMFPCPPPATLFECSKATFGLFQKCCGTFPEGCIPPWNDNSEDHMANGYRLTAKKRGGVGGVTLTTWALSNPSGWPADGPSAEALVALYHAKKPPECPVVSILSEDRERKAMRYLTRFPQFPFWQAVFDELGKSTFLRGLNNSPGHESFLGDFDWLLTRGRDGTENVVKVAEGKYRDHARPTRARRSTSHPGPPHGSREICPDGHARGCSCLGCTGVTRGE